MQVEIKHRFSGETLYTAELPGETPSGMTLRLALEQATRARANLRGANLDGANLGGETLAKAPISILNLGWNVLVTDGYMQIGCQRHTHSEWAAFDDRQIAAMDGAHALRFWRANRDWLLGACAAHTAVEAAAAEAA